jgi:hypothetical protein
MEADTRAFLRGLHFAAFERACREPRGPARDSALREIDVSLAAGGLASADERQRLVARAAAGGCRGASVSESPWTAFGRTLEAWRIAAVEGDPTAFAPERARETASRLSTLRGPDAARRKADQIAEALDRAGTMDRDALTADLADLMELLCH